MVPVVDLDMNVSDRVILEPHQVEMEHWRKTDKDHTLLRLLEEGGERREEERGERSEKGGEKHDWSQEGEMSLSFVSLVDKIYHSAHTG